MNIEDLAPKSVEFTVGNGLTLVFRPYTIADDLQSIEMAGGREALSKKFEEFDFEFITRIAWAQLETESQRAVIGTISAVTIDPDTGEEKQKNLTPIEKFRGLFTGLIAQSRLLTTLVRCKGLNIPEVTDEEGVKKFLDQMAAASKEVIRS